MATPDGPQPTDQRRLFRGQQVALFAVPGAFTPTCSARHLPGFVEKAGELKAKGVDEIACISVNDAFVMRAWDEGGRLEATSPCSPTATATSPRRSGLTLDGSKFGMGQRSQRYSMIVNDGVVEQLNVEAPGEYQRIERRIYAGPARHRLTVHRRLFSPPAAVRKFRSNSGGSRALSQTESVITMRRVNHGNEQQSRRTWQQQRQPQ